MPYVRSMLALDPSHPRPQLQREGWSTLDGRWDFALDADCACEQPDDVDFRSSIVVPFAPETRASTIANTGLFRSCWYRREFTPPACGPGQRLFLRFGAVDYQATVWVNGLQCVRHEGGYTPFSIDLTAHLSGRTLTVVVRAVDDPEDLAKPRGKQDWQREPHSIWYPRTTGIWQTVWLELVPELCIEGVRWTPNLERWELGLEACLSRESRAGERLGVRITVGGRVLVDDSYELFGHELARRLGLSDPGIDDSRNALLWSPESPTLMSAELELRNRQGECLDRVASYTALRSIGTQGDRIVFNGRPYPLRLVLDQGYWPDTGMTPPSSDALRRDVELAKAMGFNGVRKHQKLEDPRYLYWADRLGLLVWEEMASAYRFTPTSVQRITRQWLEVLARDYSHPCIIAWVPFNESWGVPNLPDSPAERHWVQALYHLTRTLDPTRPVVGNDGWESVATDIVGIHDYGAVASGLAQRYQSHESRPALFRHARPGGRILVFNGETHLEHPIVLSEFGGIGCSSAGAETWGYHRCADPAEFARMYAELLETVRSLGLLSGFCYTQFADTYQEANGLLHADRTPKFPLEEIAAATRGPRHPR
jgi:beta-galactosidase/beta-glucuronidase